MHPEMPLGTSLLRHNLGRKNTPATYFSAAYLDFMDCLGCLWSSRIRTYDFHRVKVPILDQITDGKRLIRR